MSNKQNDHFNETAYDAQCEDMLDWAVQNQIDDLRKDMHQDRLKATAEKIRAKLQQKTIDLMSKRLDEQLKTMLLQEKLND